MKTKHPITTALGKKIRTFRKFKGFSQEEFADLIGMDRSYFGCIERGEQNISIINLFRIAKGLKVEIGELFPSLKMIK